MNNKHKQSQTINKNICLEAEKKFEAKKLAWQDYNTKSNKVNYNSDSITVLNTLWNSTNTICS